MQLPINRLFFFCSLVLLCFSSLLKGQTINYAIFHGDDKIGKLVVEKTVSENKVSYQSDSESHFSLLFDNEFITHSRAEFIDNVLAYCESKTLHNGKIREHSVTERNTGGYSLFKHPEDNTILKHAPVTLSTLNLYFLEPIGVDWIFSENYQELCPVKAIDKNTYEVILPGGKINHYIYENGSLLEIKVFRTLVDLSFRLQKGES